MKTKNFFFFFHFSLFIFQSENENCSNALGFRSLVTTPDPHFPLTSFFFSFWHVTEKQLKNNKISGFFLILHFTTTEGLINQIIE